MGISLYQKDLLKQHIEYFEENRKIYNPMFVEPPYDTIGVIDALFKVVTSELFELFKMLWNVKVSKHKNKDIYNLLSQEYTTILFKIRGIYFTKKEAYITALNNNEINKEDKSK